MPTTQEIRANFPGYFKNADIKSLGKAGVVYTIKGLATEEIGIQEKELKDVISFEETRKKLVLNMTRMNQLCSLFDDEVIGEKVRLYFDLVEVRGSDRPMICIGLPE
jgi:hypothetical protein